VLHDAFARGWRAAVDNRDVPVLPVNILSRGVVVPPGRHRIELTYVPPGLIAGATISAIGLIVLVVAAWRAAELNEGLRVTDCAAEAQVRSGDSETSQGDITI
jgi:uncharacterized membrane protein YfhO